MRVEQALGDLWWDVWCDEDGDEFIFELLVRVAAGKISSFMARLVKVSVEQHAPSLSRVLGRKRLKEMQPVEKVLAGLILV